jgi:hypothetical protein
MDLNEQLDDNFNNEDLDLETRTAFLEAAKWSKGLIIIIGVIFGLSVLLLFAAIVFSNAGQDSILVLILALFWAIPFYYLYQFTTKTKKAIETLDDVLFTFALQNLKSFFKFWGILSLLIIAYYAFAILALVINVTI